MIREHQLVIIGAGPAGLAAALEAEKAGVEDILLLERDEYLGGILQQCIHNGFGLDYFGEELTGPEYAERFIDDVRESSVKIRLKTMVLNISPDNKITAINEEEGMIFIKARAIILAMGCRERTREAIKIPGTRPAGILTAGTAQRFINIEGYLPGREVVILGSGDIGLIMARRMALEGAEVKGVLEIMPYSSGLVRNKVQCLDDFGIPLKLQHTVDYIYGKQRLEAVDVVQVDDNFNPLPETREKVECDTLLLSVGLIPENELSRGMGLKLASGSQGPPVNELRETEIPGVYACGNVLQVHDLVDYVSEEAEVAARAAAGYLADNLNKREREITIEAGKGINFVIPHKISYRDESRKLIRHFLRVDEPRENIKIVISDETGSQIARFGREIVTPGEMETVKLPESLIPEGTGKLEFSIAAEGAEKDGKQ